jgi:hypothetical protein
MGGALAVGDPRGGGVTAGSRTLLASPCVELWVWLFVRPLMDKQPAATLKAELWEILQVSGDGLRSGGDKSLLECLNPF